MSLSVRIDYGAGWVELTNFDGAGTSLVKKEGLSKTEILHKDGKSVINTCSYITDMPVTLASDLISLPSTQPIILDIDRDGVNWFTGYARPVTEFSVSAENGYVQKEIQWSGVDRMWELKKVLASGVSYTDYKVCDPSDTANSIVHALLQSAGVSLSDINISVSITSVIPVISFNADSKEYFDLLSDLLYCYGASLNVDSNGFYYVYLWADPSVPEKEALSIWGASESLFRAERNDSDQERVQVKWRKFNSYTDRILFSQTADIRLDKPGTPGRISEYPADSSTKHSFKRELDGDEIVKISNLNIKTYLKYLVPEISGVNIVYTEGFPKRWFTNNSSISFTYTNTDGVDYTFSGTWLNIAFTPNLEDFSATLQYSIGSSVTWTDPYSQTGSADVVEVKIGEYRIYGDIQTIGERWTAEVGSGSKLYSFDAPYIFNQTDAENLAQAILDLKEINSTLFTVRVDTDVPVGTYIRLQNDQLAIDTVVRIIRKVDDIGSEKSGYKVYRYIAEAAAPLSVVTSSVDGGTFAIVPTDAELTSGASASTDGLSPDGQILKAIEGELMESFTPRVPGLYFSDEYLGFYDGGDWSARIKSDGTFKFLGDADNFIEWDGAALKIQGDAQSANFVSGSAGWQLNNAGDAEFNDVTVRGTIEADDGDIGGWNISSASLQSAPDGNSRIELNPGENRIEVWSNSAERVAMGYLGGLSDPADRLQTLASTVFGFWTAEGDALELHGDMIVKNGQYQLEDDASIEVKDSATGNPLLRLGTEAGIRGLHYYDTSATPDGSLKSTVRWDDDKSALFANSKFGASEIGFFNANTLEATIKWDSANGLLYTDAKLAVWEELWFAGQLYDTINDIDDDAADFAEGTLTDVEADSGGYLRLAESDALSFDGTNDIIETSYYFPTTLELTIELWINGSFIEDYSGIIGDWWYNLNTGGARNIGIKSDNTVYLNISKSGASWDTITTETVPDNQWFHLACVLDSSYNTYIYINGILSKTGSHGLSSFSPQETVWIGLWKGGADALPNRKLDGILSDVRIWDVARTQSEIQDNMHKRLTGSETGLVAYYKLDEGSGTTAADSAGSNDGTISGATWTTSTLYFADGDGDGNRVSPNLSLDDITDVESSSISWTTTTPTDTSVTVETRISEDGGSTWGAWQTATSGSSVPGISVGDDLTNHLLQVRQNLSTTDITKTPQLSSLSIEIIYSNGSAPTASVKWDSLNEVLDVGGTIKINTSLNEVAIGAASANGYRLYVSGDEKIDGSLVLTPQSSDPASPVNGQIWVRS